MIRTASTYFLITLLLVCLLGPAVVSLKQTAQRHDDDLSADRQEVVFWHFWGGAELNVVDNIVRRFNAGQSKYFVRAVAMPGNNLDLKLFLSLAGGDPPDVVNIDDPVLADWAERDAILPLSAVAKTNELANLQEWLFPAARKLTSYQSELYGLCNGLDVRALYYNETLLNELNLKPPTSIVELDQAAAVIAHNKAITTSVEIGFLPAAKNLWAWGIVFGGRFYDGTASQVTVDSPEIAAALEWMSSYGKRYGILATSLRARDQSLPGKTFPLLNGRYAMVVDGQWRARDIRQFNAAQRLEGKVPTEFGVTALPQTANSVVDGGWINGNYFVLPVGAHQTAGAWEFMKFWSGFGGHESAAAKSCESGGWIPVSQAVVDEPTFQSYLDENPIFASFVRMASSENQITRPNVPGAPRFDREVRALAERAMDPANTRPLKQLLEETNRRIQQHINFHRERTQ